MLWSVWTLSSCQTRRSAWSSTFITSVYDGDTFTDFKKIKYRLFGVDTAELKRAKSWIQTQGLEHLYALRAQHYVAQLILGHSIKYQIITHDQYHRAVVKVQIGTKDLGRLLIQHGLARMAYISLQPQTRYFTTDTNYYLLLQNAQSQAQKAMRGFWNDPTFFGVIFPKALKINF